MEKTLETSINNQEEYNSRQKYRRFTRKPSPTSSRSHSKKSDESSRKKQIYIKTPRIIRSQQLSRSDSNFTTSRKIFENPLIRNHDRATQRKQRLFSDDLAQINIHKNNDKKHRLNILQDSNKQKDRTFNHCNWPVRIRILQSQIDMKNHQISVLSSQLRQITLLYNSQKQKRKKTQQQCTSLNRQLKQLISTHKNTKNNIKLEIQLKKFQQEREILFGQIQFLQKINFDEKTRAVQTYREKYLERQLEKIKQQLNKQKSIRQQQLQNRIHEKQQENYILQSEYKAMKVANQVLVKKIYTSNTDLHQTILKSKQYQYLRQKYAKFLIQYQNLRKQYLQLRTENIQLAASKDMVKNHEIYEESLLELSVSDKQHSGQLKKLSDFEDQIIQN